MMAGEPKYPVTAIVDLTEQKYSSEIIQKQYEQLQATFDLSSVGIVNVAFEGNDFRLNWKFCEIIGYSEEELLKMNFREITYPEDLETNLDTINRAIEDLFNLYSIEKRYIRKDQAIIWVNVESKIILDAEEKPDYFIGIIQDITERKKTDEIIKH